MIEDFPREPWEGPVLRLASVLVGDVSAALLRRGLSPQSLDDAVSAVDSSGVELTADQLIAKSFTPDPHYANPFPPNTRFGTGEWPVYYAAEELETCVAEVQYHLKADLNAGEYFSVIRCSFRGDVFNLLGREESHPELVSLAADGYPYCQRLAALARTAAQALRTASARRSGGRCVPVFERSALVSPEICGRGKFEDHGASHLVFNAFAK